MITHLGTFIASMFGGALGTYLVIRVMRAFGYRV